MWQNNCYDYVTFVVQWRIQGGGGGRIGRGPPPPFFSAEFSFWGGFFFFACHPGGRSGGLMVPLPNNVNDAKKISEKKCVGVPPPPLSDFSGLARHRGIWIPGPPFSQILDPPL